MANPGLSGDELGCLASTVYWESAAESAEGQRAVAHVVLNRVGRPGFAATICGVVHQGGKTFPCQFHWYCTQGSAAKTKDPRAWNNALAIAQKAVEEKDPTSGALFFHAARLGQPWPKKRYVGARVIGNHIFLH